MSINSVMKETHHISPQEAEDPQLVRKLSRFNMLSMTFAILNTWIALAGIMGLVLPSGGPVAFIYGFIFCVLCNLCLTASLGELASIWPTSGGQYHFAYMLGNERWRRLASFSVGWLSIAGWLTLVTTACYFAVFFINAAVIVATDGAYELKPWKTYLIFCAIIVFTTVANLYGNKIIGVWNNAALMWSLLCFAIVSIVLLATSKKTTANFVFIGFDNKTGWINGIACVLGIVQSALSLIGCDAATHMSEEMPNPSRDTPKAMVYSVAMGGITGAVFLLVVLFCLDNIDEILATATGMPLTEMILRSTGSKAAAVVLTLAMSICFINGTNAAVTTVSRLMYVMARDEGAPASKFFAYLDPRFNVPSRTIMVCCVFNLAFGLLYLGPTVAFNAYTASTTILLNVSYVVPIAMHLINGRRAPNGETAAFNLGKLGFVWNWISLLFVIFICVFLCFPAGVPVTSSSMNYVTVVFGIFGLFVALTWAWTRKRYHGPDITILTGLNMVESHVEPYVKDKHDHKESV